MRRLVLLIAVLTPVCLAQDKARQTAVRDELLSLLGKVAFPQMAG
jgi:hypothetical protein